MSEVSGLVFDVRRFSVHDGPGIRTSFFLKGCPLSCPWCHNPEGIPFGAELLARPERCVSCGACAEACPSRLEAACVSCGACAAACPSGARELVGVPLTVDDVVARALADEGYYDESLGGVTFSGGEPLAQAGFVSRALEALRARGIHSAVDTSGYVPSSAMDSIAEQADLFLYDLKYIDGEKHEEMIGVDNEIILSNIKLLADRGADVIVSLPFVPGMNDDERNLRDTARFVARLRPAGRSSPYPVRILPYHDSARGKYARRGLAYPCDGIERPSGESLAKAASYFTELGIPTTIGGLS